MRSDQSVVEHLVAASRINEHRKYRCRRLKAKEISKVIWTTLLRRIAGSSRFLYRIPTVSTLVHAPPPNLPYQVENIEDQNQFSPQNSDRSGAAFAGGEAHVDTKATQSQGQIYVGAGAAPIVLDESPRKKKGKRHKKNAVSPSRSMKESMMHREKIEPVDPEKQFRKSSSVR